MLFYLQSPPLVIHICPQNPLSRGMPRTFTRYAVQQWLLQLWMAGLVPYVFGDFWMDHLLRAARETHPRLLETLPRLLIGKTLQPPKVSWRALESGHWAHICL